MKIQIENHDGRLRLRWHDGTKRQTLAIGMSDSALGRSVAESKKALIEEDWHKDRYDPTLVKYRPQTMGKTATIVTAPELFEKFAAHKNRQERLSRSSIEPCQSIVKLLEKHLNQPANKIDKSQVDRFVKVYGNTVCPRTGNKICARTVKERCSLIESAWEWAAEKYQLTKDNPWVGAADRFKISPQQQVKPFTLPELHAIRAAFASHPKYTDYLDFVTFLMHTACRFGEAAALRWKHLGTDYTTAWIGASVSRGNHRDATKTGKDRTIILSPTSIENANPSESVAADCLKAYRDYLQKKQVVVFAASIRHSIRITSRQLLSCYVRAFGMLVLCLISGLSFLKLSLFLFRIFTFLHH